MMLKELFKQVTARRWLAFLIVGGILAIVSAISGLGWKDGEVVFGSSLFVAFASAFCLIFGAILIFIPPKAKQRRGPAPKASIVSPKEGDKCPDMKDFSGSFEGQLFPGWDLWLIRRYTASGPILVGTKIAISPGNAGGVRAWSAESVFVGGESGHERHFELWMVSSDISAFFEHVKAVSEAYWSKVKAYKSQEAVGGNKTLYPFDPLPGITTKLQDVVPLHRIRVYRR